jgi:uncharacterized protein (DUF302 family)
LIRSPSCKCCRKSGDYLENATEWRTTILISPYIIALLVAGFGAARPAVAIDGFETKPSNYSVAETMDRLDSAIRKAGATVFARIDLKALVQKEELLRPHQIIIFGRCGALQPFLTAASTSGIDLPQKLPVFEGPKGQCGHRTTPENMLRIAMGSRSFALEARYKFF